MTIKSIAFTSGSGVFTVPSDFGALVLVEGGGGGPNHPQTPGGGCW